MVVGLVVVVVVVVGLVVVVVVVVGLVVVVVVVVGLVVVVLVVVVVDSMCAPHLYLVFCCADGCAVRGVHSGSTMMFRGRLCKHVSTTLDSLL